MNGHHRNSSGTMSGRLIVGPQLTRSVYSASRTESERILAATGAPHWELSPSPRRPSDTPKIPSSPRWDAPHAQYGSGVTNGNDNGNGWRGAPPPRSPAGPGMGLGGGVWPQGSRPPAPDANGEAWSKVAGNDDGIDDRQHNGWPSSDKNDMSDVPTGPPARALANRPPSPGTWHTGVNGYLSSNGHPVTNGYPASNGKPDIPTSVGSLDSSWARGGITSWGVGAAHSDSGPRTDGRGMRPQVHVSLTAASDLRPHSNGHDDSGPLEDESPRGPASSGWTKESPGESGHVPPYPTTSWDGLDSNGAHASSADHPPHVQKPGNPRPHSPPRTTVEGSNGSNGLRSPSPMRMGPMFETADWPSFKAGSGLRSSRSVDTGLATSASNGHPASRRDKASPSPLDLSLVDLGGPLPRRNLTSSAADVASLRGAMASLQATVEALAAQVQQVAQIQRTMLMQKTTDSSGRGGGEEAPNLELPDMVGKLAEGVAGGMSELAALIRAKDQQQQIRLFNLASAFDHDELIPPPNDQGDHPPTFPATRQDFAMLTPEKTDELVEHYQLPMEPQHNRLDRLGRFVGLRFS